MKRSIAFYRDGFRIALVCALLLGSSAIFNSGAARPEFRLGLAIAGAAVLAVALSFFIAGRKAERSEGKS